MMVGRRLKQALSLLNDLNHHTLIDFLGDLVTLELKSML